jgi:hypothetical protein
MSTVITNVPKVINGDTVIGFKTTESVKQMGWMDRASLSSWYKEDPNKNHLGLVNLFTNFAEVRVPIYQNLFANKAVMEVNGADGTFTYDLPVYKPTGTFTMKDTSTEHDFPGIDESLFPIGLSKPYQPGDVLTYDKQYGDQLVISEDYPITQEGDYWLHMATINTQDAAKYFDKSKLKAGIQYFKIGHVLGEFSTQFSNLESPDNMGTMTCEFVLGNHRGVETFETMYAGMKSFSGAATHSKQYWNMFQDEMAKIKDDMGRKLDMFYVGKLNANGKVNSNTLRLGSTLEYLVLLEHMKIEAQQLLFQKGGVIRGSNGVKRLNEGLWHQIRRGRVIKYSRPGGITREHIRQAAAYIFQGRPDLQPIERNIKFKAGARAFENMLSIFQEEVRMQVQNLGIFLGTDRLIQNPVSGDNMHLKLSPVAFTKVSIPDIGNIEIEYDPSLNYQLGSERFSRGFAGRGEAHDSYSLVIWDAAQEEYSNARTNLPSGTTLIDGGNKGANIYYVKPEGDSMWWGFGTGRWSPDKTSEIASSTKTMGREFWVHSISACWVRDISKFLVIELKR